ncbi:MULTISPECIES: hypothetical protein [Halolamina]|uniref:Uncharacterized protein n=1 Tax=Halolamina pelagica TaxID=699431 RepID=A0A1I5VX65_9EURY|nr:MULTISPECIES: hypothetical protein [Halolamina]SFQ12069.1 hypothetical protein SAMN05216277_12114 [Halolamina pelagica]
MFENLAYLASVPEWFKLRALPIALGSDGGRSEPSVSTGNEEGYRDRGSDRADRERHGRRTVEGSIGVADDYRVCTVTKRSLMYPKETDVSLVVAIKITKTEFTACLSVQDAPHPPSGHTKTTRTSYGVSIAI